MYFRIGPETGTIYSSLFNNKSSFRELSYPWLLTGVRATQTMNNSFDPSVIHLSFFPFALHDLTVFGVEPRYCLRETQAEKFKQDRRAGTTRRFPQKALGH